MKKALILLSIISFFAFVSINPGTLSADEEERVKTITVAEKTADLERFAESEHSNSNKKDDVKKTVAVEATAYTAFCEGCSGITKTGIDLREEPDQKVIAVDPEIIPLGSKVRVPGYGEAIAGDTGGAIQGHRIDLFMEENDDAMDYGRKQVEVEILES
ncbi:3D domain-containing protein [Halobacillus andaensis]|uniref:3D domain-containing protein n=1 Tax=Halobacillus andaensis TaxID=1176239 RepID=UPI003D755E90